MHRLARIVVATLFAVGAVAAPLHATAQSAFSHVIEVKVPRGAGGMQPALALVYDPSLGNGNLGVGWQLSGFSAIRRVHYDAAIAYQGTDTFAHTQLGILVQQYDGTYRSKSESFARAERVGSCGDGPCSWIVKDRSGLTFSYGTTTDSRLLKQGTSSVRAWALARVQDVSGNHYDVAYSNEAANGHLYPISVTYTKGPNLGPKYRTVELSYEPREDAEPGYEAGAFDQTTSRLKWISVKTDGVLIRKYRLDYECGQAADACSGTRTNRSRLVAVQEYGSDGVSTLPAQTFVWQAGAEMKTYAGSTFAAGADLLVQVNNGIGGSVQVDVVPAPIVPNAVLPDSLQPGIPNSSPRQLVTHVTSRDGRGGSFGSSYVYRDGRVLPGTISARRNLGFLGIDVIDDQTRLITRRTFNQAPGYEGTVAKEEDLTSGGLLIKQKLHDFELVNPLGTTGVELVRESQETLRAYELGAFSFSQFTKTSYDDYGNPLVKTQYADGLPTVTVTMTYINDTASWILGRVKTMTTTSGGQTLGDLSNTWIGNRLTEKREWLDTSNTWRVTTLDYDANGNVRLVTEGRAADGLPRSTQTEYDATFRAHPSMVTNALNQTTRSDYYDDGSLKTTWDLNSRTIVRTYDVFGRRRTEVGPGTRFTEWEYRNYGDPNSQCSRTATTVDTRVVWKEEYFDGSGFIYGTTASGDCSSAWVVVDQRKDWAGRPYQTSQPYCYGTPLGQIAWTTTDYDQVGRVAKITTPDGKSTQYGHTATYATVTDANGHVTKKYFDARNRTISVVDAADQVTSYGYDALGRLSAITTPDLRTTRIYYDSLNRRTRVEEPQVAATTYAYDDPGNLTTLVSRGKTVAFKYDALNRVVEKRPIGEVAVTFTYDEAAYANPVGRVTTVVDASGTAHLGYSSTGQIAAFARRIDGKDYTQSFTYDRGDRLIQVTYPNGSYATYSYTNGGNMASVSLDGAAIATWGNYDAAGKPGGVTYGNGVSTTYAYDGMEHLVALSSKKGTEVLQDLTYDWYGRPNTGGLNLGAITDHRANKQCADGSNANETQLYTYDLLDRLTKAEFAWGAKSYAYDAMGNPTTFGGIVARTLGYVGQQVASGTGLSEVTHDASTGNMTHRVLDGVDAGYRWTAEGRLATVTTNGVAIAEMTYDADGTRVKKVYTPSVGPSVTTTYAGPMYERRTYSDGSPERHTLHVFGNGQLVASVTKTGSILTALTNPNRWRMEWALGSLYDARSPGGAAKKLLSYGRAVAAYRPLVRWLGIGSFAAAAAWVLATALVALRRRGFARRLSPSLRLASAGIVLMFGFTACNAGPGGAESSEGALLDGDTRLGPTPGTYFYHRNHINSSSVITDYLGNEATRYVYLPFGEVSNANSCGRDSVTAKFTGQEFDEETSLYYYRARYYDPAIGRFLSPDTVLPSLTDAQTLNRYSYVRNNPVVYTDPTGHVPDVIGGVMQAAARSASAISAAAARAERWVEHAAKETGDYFGDAGRYAALITKAMVKDRATWISFAIAVAISIATLNPAPLTIWAQGMAASIAAQSLALAAGVRNPTVLMVIANVAALVAGSASLGDFLKAAGAVALTSGLAYAEREALGADTATKLAPLNALAANLIVNGIANELGTSPADDAPEPAGAARSQEMLASADGDGVTLSVKVQTTWQSLDPNQKLVYLFQNLFTIGGAASMMIGGVAAMIAGGPFTVTVGILGFLVGGIGTAVLGANVIRDFTVPQRTVCIVPANAG